MSTVAPNSDTARSSDWAFKQLFKLESKCRSPTPALQVEAIGEFPKLLDQFPFPTLVSSAFLKLGDLFRSSPNSLRYHIAQVFGASQQHLAQITQTEELLKRILVVLYSNDPIARVLALRLIGNASLIFAKFPEAQHSILLRYQSSHPLEIVAAVQTTESMLSYSPEFLEVVWETVLSKADDPDVPDSVRVQLIRSLQHAAPNLMLSTLLYSHCQHWACDTDSTNIIRCAAMDTWKAIIQRHNELQSVDAKHISGYVLHDLASLRRSALALLGKWKPKGQTVDASCLNEIQQRLTDCLHLPADSNMTIVGFGELRLAATVLARIEVACGNVNASQSWLAAYKYAARALEVFSDTTFATSSALSLNMSGQSSANDRPGIDPVYRLLISSVMLVINISTILDSSEYRSVTATIVRDSWLAITKRGESASEARYLRRFLRKSWSWCKSMRVESSVIAALQDMVGSLSKPVTCQVINIGSSTRYFDCIAGVCRNNMERFVEALNLSNLADCNSRAVWHAISVALACQKRHLKSALSSMAVNAISQWSKHLYSLIDQPDQHVKDFSASGPPAWMFQIIMSLLSANGYWSTLHELCQAPPMHCLSSNIQSWFYAVSNIAIAEASVSNITLYTELTDMSLRTLRAMDTQGTPCSYRLFLVQLRRELVCLHYEWSYLQTGHSTSPAAHFVAKSLAGRTRSLASQTELVCGTFSLIDTDTRKWLTQTQQSLQRAMCTFDAMSTKSTAANSDIFDVQNVATTALSALGEQTLSFCPGSTFLSEPPQPTIFIESRPDLDSGSSPFTVFTGTEFHFVIEGFLRLPQCALPATPQQIRIAVWLSDRPFGSSNQDLKVCSEYYRIAQSAMCHGSNGPNNFPSGNGALATVLDKATAFEAQLDGAYFTCPCAIAMPSLRDIFDHTDANVLLHLHIFCALVDTTDHAWWTGPHASYPLLISTTAKA